MADILPIEAVVSFKEAATRLGQKEAERLWESPLLCSSGGTFLCTAADISS